MSTVNTTAPRGCFWKIEDSEGNKGYILGSIHINSGHLLDLGGKIMRCFQKSRTLAVETDITSEQFCNDIRKIQLDEIGSNLHLCSPSTQKQIAENARIFLKVINNKESNVALSDDKRAVEEGIIKMNELILSPNRKGYDSGFEMKLTAQAKTRNLPIHDLENLDDTINSQNLNTRKSIRDLFDRFQTADFSKLPPDFVQKLEQKKSEMIKKDADDLEQCGVHENWEKGNLDFFERWNQKGVPPLPNISPELNANELSLDHHERTDRNQEMAKKIENLVKDGKKPFAVPGIRHMVGAGFEHRPGKFSIPHYLEKSGLKVTRKSI